MAICMRQWTCARKWSQSRRSSVNKANNGIVYMWQRPSVRADARLMVVGICVANGIVARCDEGIISGNAPTYCALSAVVVI
jgi:hypothetical protein